MENILGLDLGTNSIGWTIRETENENGEQNQNQIIDYGVVIFEKGVGDGKNGEFSLAAERRKHRGKRRLYNAKRYRKWELLKFMIENKMCPLTKEELKLWRVGEWNKGEKNKGRKYPMNPHWLAWLAMDEKYFGHNGIIEKNHNEKSSYKRKSPYDLRCELLETFETDEQKRKYKIGRALYHLVQRRGFKSSRKGGKSTFKPDESYEKAIQENSQLTPAVIWNKELKEKNIRIRGRGKIDRVEFEKELEIICNKQRIEKSFAEKLHDAIYDVRDQRSQKGLVGKCTLEKGKPRIPISHPMFEEFRALQFINNIQWREAGSNNEFESIPMPLKKKILEELFFKTISRGESKGKVDDRSYFKFDEIIETYSDYENKKWEFNYRNKPNVSTCPVIAGMMNVFNEEWENKFIQDENKFGINWSGLAVAYTVKYGKAQGKSRTLKIDYASNNDSLWHLLFDYIQTKDNDAALQKFLVDVAGFTEPKAKEFSEIKIQQGYGSLSQTAIRKIITYLQQGKIYSEAVSFANLKEVLGGNDEAHRALAQKTISETIKSNKIEKRKFDIVNGLIQQFYGNASGREVPGITDKNRKHFEKEIDEKLKSHFGESNWNKFSEIKEKEYKDFVTEKYFSFLNGKQKPEEKAAFTHGKNPETDYYKLPRLDEAIKDVLRKPPFNATEENLKKLYHPSDIKIYSSAEEKKVKNSKDEIVSVKQLGDPMPPSKGWKNPMAMRTMHELKKLINYLLRENKIDEDTKIVVELARELNDANKRKAIEEWNRDREKENEEYALAIAEMHKIKKEDISEDDYNKFRSAVEQISEENKSAEFLEKYAEFIETFLVKKTKKKKEEENNETDDETKKEEEKIPYEYLMYLILTREQFTRLLLDQPPGAGKILNLAKDFQGKRKVLKDMLTKYRLWKQQKFQCLYTGQQISFTELFSNNYQIEHTIPRTISFDSELKNLTVCDAVYNNYEKDNCFPTECKNYNASAVCQTVKGKIECTPIIERVERLIKPKVDELKTKIKNLQSAAKKIQDWEVDKKNANIRLRHYLQFELDYWNKKYFAFTVERKDWKDKWKNSQLVDTQLISKYSRAYMKSLFNRVDIQKGITTDTFKKIFGIKGDEQKDRSKHSHHAVDALVLTLIPGSAKREAILKLWYEIDEKEKSLLNQNNKEKRNEIEDKIKEKKKELSDELFTLDLTSIRKKVNEIENNILINHVSNDQTLTHTKKKVRKRGEVVFLKNKQTKQLLKDKDGNNIPMWMRGDSVRGQLNEETFLGAIKIVERDKKGNALKEKGKYKIKQSKGEDEILIVVRKPIDKIDFKKDDIIDIPLKNHLLPQIKKGTSQNQLLDFNNKIIRHLRCRVKAGRPGKEKLGGFLRKEKTIELKKQTFQSKHKHKQFALSKIADNYLYLLYEKFDEKNKPIRQARIISLFDFTSMGFKSADELWNKEEWNKYKEDGIEIPLTKILKAGQRTIFFSESKEEIKELGKKELFNRIFKIYKFNEVGSPSIYLQNHIEARPENELEKLEKKKDGYTKFDKNKYQYRLKLKADRMNCIVEGNDFEIKPDGEIKWKF